MYHLKVAIFDKNMAVGKSENLVIRHMYELMQPLDKGIHWSWWWFGALFRNLSHLSEVTKPPWVKHHVELPLWNINLLHLFYWSKMTTLLLAKSGNSTTGIACLQSSLFAIRTLTSDRKINVLLRSAECQITVIPNGGSEKNTPITNFSRGNDNCEGTWKQKILLTKSRFRNSFIIILSSFKSNEQLWHLHWTIFSPRLLWRET